MPIPRVPGFVPSTRGLRFWSPAGVLILCCMLGSASNVRADDASATPPAWTRSIVCPVLYTHEVPTQAVFRRFILGMLGAGYQPTDLDTVDAAMVGSMDPPTHCLVLSFDDGLLSQFLNAAPV